MNWQQQMSAADNALAQGNLPVAEYLFWQALKLAESFGPYSAQMTETAERLSDVLVRQSKFAEAEDLLLRLAEVVNSGQMQNRSGGSAKQRSANTMLKLAEVLYAQGKYDRAEPFGLSALKAYEANFGAHHPETARVAGNVAYIYHASGKVHDAESLYQRALAVKSKGPSYDAEAMNLMQSYASLLRAMHRDDEAEHLMRCVQGLQSGNWTVYDGG
ncbi:MAG TPA: tetratricopeptide repeat protein [Chroococcales cyanobacterium]